MDTYWYGKIHNNPVLQKTSLQLGPDLYLKSSDLDSGREAYFW